MFPLANRPLYFVIACLIYMAAPQVFGREEDGWPEAVQAVAIPVSDGTDQPAMWYAPPSAGGDSHAPVPLLVGLHTWSMGYEQSGNGAPYAQWCIDQKWAFVHPHFRGPNRTPEAMGSDRAVADIVEAVAWAKSRTAIDPRRVYLVGASGGAYMALLMAGRHPELWAGVSAWCPITDIAQWHADHVRDGVTGRYAQDIEASLGGVPIAGSDFAVNAVRRSPLNWLAGAAGLPLDINAGVHDGRKGSVPFTHALLAYNAVVGEGTGRLDPERIAEYYQTRQLPAGWQPAPPDPLYGKSVPLFRQSQGNTRITIFEGGHDIVYAAALVWLAAQRQGEPAIWEVGEGPVVNLQAAEIGK